MSYKFVDWYWVYHFVARLIKISEYERDFNQKLFPETLQSEKVFRSFVLASDLVRSGVSDPYKWLQSNSHYNNPAQLKFD